MYLERKFSGVYFDTKIDRNICQKIEKKCFFAAYTAACWSRARLDIKLKLDSLRC